jgi:hypothetical protein
MKRNSFIVVKPLSEITNMDVPVTCPKYVKEGVALGSLNHRKYRYLGFLDRTNDVLLETRFHNVRDRRGRFAKA